MGFRAAHKQRTPGDTQAPAQAGASEPWTLEAPEHRRRQEQPLQPDPGLDAGVAEEDVQELGQLAGGGPDGVADHCPVPARLLPEGLDPADHLVADEACGDHVQGQLDGLLQTDVPGPRPGLPRASGDAVDGGETRLARRHHSASALASLCTASRRISARSPSVMPNEVQSSSSTPRTRAVASRPHSFMR